MKNTARIGVQPTKSIAKSGVRSMAGRTTKSIAKSAIPPQTAMQAAFTRALVNWARVPRTGEITIPTGTVNAAELVRVVHALKHFAHQGEKRARLGAGQRKDAT